MKHRHVSRLMLLAFVLLALTALPFAARAQSATATLSGTVEDQNQAVVSGAKVKAINLSTGLERDTVTNDSGIFTIVLLPPSTYTVRVERDGFVTLEVSDVVLNVGDERSLRIQMRVGDIKEVVNVTDEASLIDESPAVGTVVDRQFVGNLPLNGRSFQSLISLTPGVVLTTASDTELGQFSVNGQRANANYFTVDGVGANIGVGLTFGPAQGVAGSVPGLSASGGTNNLVSVDALQEFKIQTSTYAPEFGRSPGAQVSIVTRSGTNDFRGSVFEFFRNEAMDANDWFNNANRLAKPSTRQHDFGGVLSGPLSLPRFGEGGPSFTSGRNRTFFFFSYEGLRLKLPKTALSDVPSLLARQNAPAALKPFLNAFPLPNGPDGRNAAGALNGYALFAASYSDPATLDATSIRIDHAVNSKVSVFGRYNYSPSENTQRNGVGLSSLSTVGSASVKTHTLTIALTFSPTSSLSNDLRINYSKNTGINSSSLDDFGGAVPVSDSQMFQVATNGPSIFSLFLGGAGARLARLFVGPSIRDVQRQLNLVENLSLIRANHLIKLGVDYRRLTPIIDPRVYQANINFSGVGNPTAAPVNGNVMSGRIAFNSSISAQAGPQFPIFNNFSAYAQDTWKIGRRATLAYGLRWEVNPSPTEANGKMPLTLSQITASPATFTLAPRGTALYGTTYNNFAPRVGLAYQLFQKPGRETVLRGGFGTFYDLGAGNAGNAFLQSSPFMNSKGLPAFTVFPFTAANGAPPPLNPNALATLIIAFDPNLKLPRTYQWNFSIEQSLGMHQTITASYVAALGRQLLRRETLLGTAFGGVLNPAVFAGQSTADITRNAATSDYHALELQFERRLSRGLQALASYTWSKSLDIASQDSFAYTPAVYLDPNNDRGPSDFDIRHSFSLGTTYNIPAPKTGNVARALLGDWAIDSIVRARSGPPVNVTMTADIGFGFASIRPDVIQGVPLYLNEATVPGGRRINPAAFSTSFAGRQGTLGRNSLRGFPLNQVDFALRRQFKLREHVSLQLKLEAFNVFNHPNFAPNSGDLGFLSGGIFFPSATFGRTTQMLGRRLGSGGVNGGFNPLYQVGGPRSMQLSLRMQF